MPQVESVRLEELAYSSTGRWSATVSFFLNPTGVEKRLEVGCRYNIYLVELHQTADRFFAHDDGRLDWNHDIPGDQRDGLYGPIATGTRSFRNFPPLPDPLPVRDSGQLPPSVQLDPHKQYYAMVTAKPFVHGDIRESSNRLSPDIG